MSLTHAQVVAEAQAIKSVCNEVAAMLSRIEDCLQHNSHKSIDWGGWGEDPPQSTPPYIDESDNGAGQPGTGNMAGLEFTRQQVANAVGSLDELRKLLTNQPATQGDHIGNINQLADPQVYRVRVGN